MPVTAIKQQIHLFPTDAVCMLLGNLQKITVNKQSPNLPNPAPHIPCNYEFLPCTHKNQWQKWFWLYWSQIRCGFFALILPSFLKGHWK